jgi:hypothetical protein
MMSPPPPPAPPAEQPKDDSKGMMASIPLPSPTQVIKFIGELMTGIMTPEKLTSMIMSVIDTALAPSAAVLGPLMGPINQIIQAILGSAIPQIFKVLPAQFQLVPTVLGALGLPQPPSSGKGGKSKSKKLLNEVTWDIDHGHGSHTPTYHYGHDYYMPLVPDETEDPAHVLIPGTHPDAHSAEVLGTIHHEMYGHMDPDQRDLLVDKYNEMQVDYYHQYWSAMCQNYAQFFPEAYDECVKGFSMEATKHIIGLALAQEMHEAAKELELRQRETPYHFDIAQIGQAHALQ